jgi:hypothetical protein
MAEGRFVSAMSLEHQANGHSFLREARSASKLAEH